MCLEYEGPKNKQPSVLVRTARQKKKWKGYSLTDTTMETLR